MIVPDATRTCPLGMLFKGIFAQIGTLASAFDVMIALGTHQPMNEEAICHRLEISPEEHRGVYGKVRLFNHEWDHEVVGFSGGNKYLFPGVSGPEVLNFFHWLGAVVYQSHDHRQ